MRPRRRDRLRDVTLVAVSKTVPAERVRAAVAAGLTTLGENRVQEAEAKVGEVPRRDVAPRRAAPEEQGPAGARDLRDDPVGRLRRASPSASTGSRRRSGPAAASRSCSRSTSTTIRRRPASPPAELEASLGAILDLPRLEVRGLMTIGRLVDRPEDARSTFVALRELSGRLRAGDDRPRAGAVDGHDRRLRGRDRGGRDDRPRRAGAVRRAAARSRPRRTAPASPPTATDEGSRPADARRGAGRLGRVEFRLGDRPTRSRQR